MSRAIFDRLSLIIVLFLLGISVSSGQGVAAEVEILTPPTGAKILARHPETHLVLSRPLEGGPVKIRTEPKGTVINPVIEIEGDERSYLHFRLPMVPGKNSYSLVPGGQKIELNFHKIQADLTLKAMPKDAVFFHQTPELPAVCSDCHELNEVEVVQPVGIRKQLSCATCHQNLIDAGKVKHGPTSNLECLSCHQQSADPVKIGFPAIGTQELCLTCHQNKKVWLERADFHGPLLLGGCTLCHNPHAENHKYQLWAEGATELCVTCHSNKQKLFGEDEQVPFVHGILFGTGCVACHSPHASDYHFMLHRPINKLCLSCHPTVLKNAPGHPVDRHPVGGAKDYLRPGRELSCTSCHEPHGSAHQYFLIETKLRGKLCRDCHRR